VDPGLFSNRWVLVAHELNTGCECNWESYEWVPSGLTLPCCGVTCDGGTFDEDCCMGTPADCYHWGAQVTVWPI